MLIFIHLYNTHSLNIIFKFLNVRTLNVRVLVNFVFYEWSLILMKQKIYKWNTFAVSQIFDSSTFFVQTLLLMSYTHSMQSYPCEATFSTDSIYPCLVSYLDSTICPLLGYCQMLLVLFIPNVFLDSHQLGYQNYFVVP